jgi:predicted phosphoribosyltransferase/dienelactone hydrolase
MFENREDAAYKLLARLGDLQGEKPLVLGVPRGAIPMAKIIADGLGGDLDMVLVKKIGHPLHPEFALGSVTEDGEIILGIGARQYGLSQEDISEHAFLQIERLRQKRMAFAHGRRALSPRGRTVILVDDGIATGATMSAAIHSVKARGAKRIVVAAPVASQQAVHWLELEGAEVRTVSVPEHFGAVGYYYRNFTQVSDAEVGAFFRVKPLEVDIERGDLRLKAIMGLPERPLGVVVFAHGSGSGRLSPRNQHVAETLNRHGMATVLADLLGERESLLRTKVFDIDLLAERLIEITRWLSARKDFAHLKIGYFGASTGAGAALQAAAKFAGAVCVVVSRGGRPDLAGQYLARVQAPTLLIVGGDDIPVIALNQQAYQQLRCEKKIEIVPGAGHLFEEPGTLDAVADLAVSWFRKYFDEAAHMNRATQVQP